MINMIIEKPWYSQAHYLAVFAFMLILPFMKRFGARPLLVLGLTLVAVWMQMRRSMSIVGLHKPKELHLYCIWGVWAIVTGSFLYVDSFCFFDGVKMLLRSMVMIWVLFALFCRQQKIGYMFTSLICVATIQVVAAKLGYYVADDATTQVGGEIVRDAFVDEGTRIEGITGNANAMGSVMLAGIWGSIMLWNQVPRNALRRLLQVLLVLGICVFFYYIVRTASRKSLLVVAVLMSGWLVWILPGRFSAKSFFIVLFMLLITVVLGSWILNSILSGTVMEHRFEQLLDKGGGNAFEGFKANVRYWMYIDGFQMFLNHPIAGVGLNQFRALHWSGLYSHSDYIEPLACTGLVGFILYHGFAFSITCRVLSLIKRNVPREMLYTLKGMLLFMLCNHYLIGLGCPWWYTIDHTVILVFIGTYAWRIEQGIVKHRFIYAT